MPDTSLPPEKELLPKPELAIPSETTPPPGKTPQVPKQNTNSVTPLTVKLLIGLIIFFDILLVAYIYLLAK